MWIPSLGKLEHLIQRPLSTMERFLTVANLGDNQGGWNLGAFDDVLSAGTIQKIISMTGLRTDKGDDSVVWSRTTDG